MHQFKTVRETGGVIDILSKYLEVQDQVIVKSKRLAAEWAAEDSSRHQYVTQGALEVFTANQELGRYFPVCCESLSATVPPLGFWCADGGVAPV